MERRIHIIIDIEKNSPVSCYSNSRKLTGEMGIETGKIKFALLSLPDHLHPKMLGEVDI